MTRAEKLDRLTFQDLSDKYYDICHERMEILLLIAEKLGVYKPFCGNSYLLEYCEQNPIFKALDIVPDKGLAENFKVIRQRNKRIM